MPPYRTFLPPVTSQKVWLIALSVHFFVISINENITKKLQNTSFAFIFAYMLSSYIRLSIFLISKKIPHLSEFAGMPDYQIW